MFKGYYPNKKIRNKTTAIIAAVVIIITAAVNVYSDYERFVRARQAVLMTNGLFSAHFIDVGQADATLLRSPDGEFMLIDCGDSDSAEYLIKYLEYIGVDSLEYLLITHPHEDHYGGAERVIDSYPVENFIIGDGFEDTYPFDKYIDMLEENSFDEQTKIIQAEINDRFDFADCADFMIISPKQADYENLNESSLGLKLVFGNTSFLFTGDAEKSSEKAMLSAGYDLRADVFQVGHHGSSTSNTRSFVEAVNPVYAVISCEKDNEYGHPHKEALENLESVGAQILRTDTISDIVITSDGTTVRYEEYFGVENEEETAPQDKKSQNMILEYIKSLVKRFAA